MMVQIRGVIVEVLFVIVWVHYNYSQVIHDNHLNNSTEYIIIIY